MDVPAVDALITRVLWGAFVLSAIFGGIAQKAHFCTMGAISDIVNFGDWTRMRMWGLALGVAMLGFFGMAFVGIVDVSKSLYASGQWLWLSAMLGGLFFGFGMVLASGCGSKTLVRIGGGSLKSVVVFVVMGLTAFATLRGVTAVARVATVDKIGVAVNAPGDWPTLLSASLGISNATAGLGMALVIGLALGMWALLNKSFRQFDNLLAGFGIGLVVVAMWWVTGSLAYVSEHPDTLQAAILATHSGRMEALSFVAPVAYTLDWLILFSDKSKVLTVGIASVCGVVSGSAAVALLTGNFRWEGFGGTEDLANHLVGAALMGVGGVMAIGCSIGQGLSGLSTLNLTSTVAVAAIVSGALLAFRYQSWRVERAI